MPTDFSEQSERLRVRMIRLRHTLDQDVEEVVDQAHDLLDWRYYLKNYPLTSVGVIGFLAYQMVPRKTSPHVTIDDSAIQKLLAHNERLVPEKPKEKPSFAWSMIEITAQAMLRTALTFATRKLIADTMYRSDAEMERDESQAVN